MGICQNDPKNPTLFDKLIRPMFVYKTEKYIKVDVFCVGVFYRIMQVLALMLALIQLYFNDGWALSEVPGGMSNAWDEPGSFFSTTDDPALGDRTTYCANSTYSFVDRNYVMENPICEALMAAELTAKTMSSMFFTTSIIETETRGWPCDAAAAAAEEAACEAGGGEVFERATGQCLCMTSRTIFPLAVDEMLMAFEHAYATSADFSWTGSSADPGGPGAGLFSRLIHPNGSITRYEAGELLALPLSEWLAHAGVSLDDANPSVAPDSLGRIAHRRNTGVQVRVDIQYTNRDIATQRAVIGKREIHADITLRTELATWTGVDTQTTWVVHPALPRDTPQDFHLIEKTRHGVLFQFVTSGAVYKFDFAFLLQVLVSAAVMLKLANVATDAVAFYCLPGGQSTVLRNKRQELVSKKSEFAEIGMKAALAAASYRSFDPDNNGSIEAVDIVKVFAHVEGVGWEKAHAIAHAIMSDADTTDEGESGDQPGLSYVEYMTCLEGDAINFDQFLANVDAMPEDTPDREECRLAFEEVRASLPAIVQAAPVADEKSLPAPAPLPPPADGAAEGEGGEEASPTKKKKKKKDKVRADAELGEAEVKQNV